MKDVFPHRHAPKLRSGAWRPTPVCVCVCVYIATRLQTYTSSSVTACPSAGGWTLGGQCLKWDFSTADPCSGPLTFHREDRSDLWPSRSVSSHCPPSEWRTLNSSRPCLSKGDRGVEWGGDARGGAQRCKGGEHVLCALRRESCCVPTLTLKLNWTKQDIIVSVHNRPTRGTAKWCDTGNRDTRSKRLKYTHAQIQ